MTLPKSSAFGQDVTKMGSDLKKDALPYFKKYKEQWNNWKKPEILANISSMGKDLKEGAIKGFNKYRKGWDTWKRPAVLSDLSTVGRSFKESALPTLRKYKEQWSNWKRPVALSDIYGLGRSLKESAMPMITEYGNKLSKIRIPNMGIGRIQDRLSNLSMPNMNMGRMRGALPNIDMSGITNKLSSLLPNQSRLKGTFSFLDKFKGKITGLSKTKAPAITGHLAEISPTLTKNVLPVMGSATKGMSKQVVRFGGVLARVMQAAGVDVMGLQKVLLVVSKTRKLWEFAKGPQIVAGLKRIGSVIWAKLVPATLAETGATASLVTAWNAFKNSAIIKYITATAVALYTKFVPASVQATIATWALNSALLVNPLFWIPAAIAAAAGALYLLGKALGSSEEVWNALSAPVIAVWDAFKGVTLWFLNLLGIGNDTGKAFSNIGAALAGIWTVIKPVVLGLSYLVGGIVAVTAAIVAMGASVVVGAVLALVKVVTSLFNAFTGISNVGGKIGEWLLSFELIKSTVESIGEYLNSWIPSIPSWLPSWLGGGSETIAPPTPNIAPPTPEATSSSWFPSWGVGDSVNISNAGEVSFPPSSSKDTISNISKTVTNIENHKKEVEMIMRSKEATVPTEEEIAMADYLKTLVENSSKDQKTREEMRRNIQRALMKGSNSEGRAALALALQGDV